MTSRPDLVPESFATLVRGRPAEGYDDGDTWLAALPGLLGSLLADWDLTVDGAAWHGYCALVVPVLRGGDRLALKVGWPHPEARDEHLVLRAWGGRGAVRLVAADPGRWALLLERLDGSRDLGGSPVDEACSVVGALHARLTRPALPRLPRLSDIAAADVAAFTHPPPQVPRRLAEQARSLALDLLTRRGLDDVLVHSDLHYANVLAGTREPWLAIDPKPVAGEVEYAVSPLLSNRFAEALADVSPRAHLRRRLSIACEHAGADEDRARAWTVVREVATAIWSVSVGEPARVTMAVTIVKAMDD